MFIKAMVLRAAVSLLTLGALLWIGVRIQPAGFAAYALPEVAPEVVPLRAGLPAPVDRFYRTLYGDTVPVIRSAVITGRAQLRPVGPIMLPARFRFVHDAGSGYRHYIEATLFGIPVFKVNEHYLDGTGVMQLPFGTLSGKKINQAANLGMWAESIWFPSILVTDPRVRWEPIDAQTALLIVPFEQAEERYIVRFNADSGLVDWFESMRYKDEKSAGKTLWLNQMRTWAPRNRRPFAQIGAATWMDDGKPWAIFEVEDIVLNTDVSAMIRATGP
jgi:hypothetical protein